MTSVKLNKFYFCKHFSKRTISILSLFLLPCISIFAQDTDGDGLTDADEINTYLTDPNNIDTDGDYYTDGEEVLTFMTDPLSVDLPPCNAGITDVPLLINDPDAILCIGDSQPCNGLAANGTFILNGQECCGVSGSNSCTTLSIELGSAVGGLQFEIFGANSFDAYELTPSGCNLIGDATNFCAPADRFRILICKPGNSWNNSIGLTPIPALDLVVTNERIYNSCDPIFTAQGTTAPVTWAAISPDADLAYFDCGSGLGVNINCTNPTFVPPVTTDCNGINYTYEISAIDECTMTTQSVRQTTILYPDITADFSETCNAAGDMVTLEVSNTNCTDYTYLWHTNDTGNSITISADGSAYSVSISRPIASLGCTPLIFSGTAVCVSCGADNGTLINN